MRAHYCLWANKNNQPFYVKAWLHIPAVYYLLVIGLHIYYRMSHRIPFCSISFVIRMHIMCHVC